MLHDPEAFAHVARKMRKRQPAGDPVELPPLSEIVSRLEKAALTEPDDGPEPQA